MKKEIGTIEEARRQEKALNAAFQDGMITYEEELEEARKEIERYKKKCRKLKKRNRNLEEKLKASQCRARKYKKKAKEYKRVIRRERYAFGVNPYVSLTGILNDSMCLPGKKPKKSQETFSYLEASDHGNVLYDNMQLPPFMFDAIKRGAVDVEFRERGNEK